MRRYGPLGNPDAPEDRDVDLDGDDLEARTRALMDAADDTADVPWRPSDEQREMRRLRDRALHLGVDDE